MRVNVTIAITAGTPQNLAVAAGLLATAALSTTNGILANRIDAQMAEGTAAFGYYMDLANFAAGTQANKATAGHVSQQLLPASATSPGATFTDGPTGISMGTPRDVTKIWLDTNVNASVIVSFDLRL